MPLVHLTCAAGSPFDISRFMVREALSEGFVVDLVGQSEDPNVDLAAIIGQEATFELSLGLTHATKGRRTWTGIVSHIEQVHGVHVRGSAQNMSTYRVVLAPRLWLLTKRINHRIFQRLSIPDIIDKLLKDWAITPKWKITRSNYKKLEIKFQYGETDYAFFNRLLEEAGITYAIDGADNSALVMSDDIASTPLHEHPAALPSEDNPNESAQREYVTNVSSSYDVRPGAFQFVDFNFRNPSFRMAGEAKKAPDPENSYEQYHYRPTASWQEGRADGATPTADDKGAYRADATYLAAQAQRALDGARTGRRIVHFETNVIDLSPGMGVKIEHHPADAVNAAYLVTSFSASGQVNSKWAIECTCVYKHEPYRPALRTPTPRVFGVQSATVVGPKGQEIHTDEFGRVRVQFPWDRDGASDDSSSCWMRVNQGWAGTGFGMIIIPRIGQEVLVGFLDGDCDSPMVMGRVYNFLNPVPYKLPENKTVSGWKTNSSPTNGGYNEIKLEDKATKELMYIQAQKDKHVLVKRDLVKRIERRHRRTILEDQHLIVKKIKKELIEVDDHLHVKGDRFQKIDKSTSLTVGVDQDEKVGNKHALEAGKEIHLKAGTKVVIEAGSELTVKGPGGHMKIHSGGIDIVGTLVKINSGGSPGSGSGATPHEPKDAEEALPKDSSEQIED
jgi:type VI secretion system secreted protein VgrG